ncbi:mitochondrial 37S ribosomal protein uS10m RSM10 [Rhodotorula paludigena]|uniref:mitochondrial 37S ribosomal protein uS10m RSM10 n=1 Tax=Rhodotorula paludigena TaxID=86838 RepID=UPI00317B42C6
MSFPRTLARLHAPARAVRAASTAAQPSPAAAAPPPPPRPQQPAPSPSTSSAPASTSSAPTPAPSSSSSPLSTPAASDPSPVFGRHVPLPPTHGVHVATLHLRSYTDSVPDLQFFTSFALRAARALGLPTSGAVALPTRTSLYTVPRSPFAHKKSQQNFWRKEHKRAIKVFDGTEHVVQAWLAYLRKEALGGVGMKAQVFTYREVGWGKDLVSAREAEEQQLAAAGAVAGGAGSDADGAEPGAAEVERLARELEEELKAGIEDAERAESSAALEAAAGQAGQGGEGPVVEAAKELKEVEASEGTAQPQEVPVKGEQKQ